MKLSALLGAAMAASAIFLGAQGCSSSTAATTGVKCTPGNYVFCRCADRAEGTKLCKEDGASFEACSTGTAGQCVGGEDLTDPNTGTEVDPPKQPPQEAGLPGSAVDACPGKPTAVTPGADIVIDGDTTGAQSDLKGRAGACAAGDGGPDHVYHLQPTGSGELSVTVKGEGALNPLMYLRTTCTDEESQSSCAPPLGAAGQVQLKTNVVTGRDYYLVVDGASGSAGKYKLTLNLTTKPFCGDGKIDSGEACDDANKTEGDGCSNSCRAVDGNPAGADCLKPHVVHMWKGQTVSGTGSTVSYGNTFTKPGSSCDPTIGSNIAPDHVYEVTAHSAGTLKVTMTPEATFNGQLVATKACAAPAAASDLAGDTFNKCNVGSVGAAEIVTVPVQNNQKVYVTADGVLTGKGAYTIKFELP
jgi:cysteine-rich repeat protein